MNYIFVVFFSVVFLMSCNQEIKREDVLVSAIASPAGSHSSLPFLFSNDDQTLLSWVEKVGDSLTELKYAALVDGEWQKPQRILQGSDWFVNWADFPAIAAQNGNLISHVLKKSSAGTYSYDVKLNFLPAGETKWNTNLPLHTDGTATEHGFVTAIPFKDGFFTTWLDGRNSVEDEHGQRGAMTLRAAEVSPDGEIRNEIELDNRACDCCQTTAAITANGPVVIYRDRSESEVRDMSIVRWENGQWTVPKTVYSDNWVIKGCPVNGPKAASFGNALVTAWFTAANNKPKLQLIFSADGGASFDTSIVVAEKNVIGRVDVLLLDEGSAIVSWMEAQEGIAQLKAAKIHRDGTKEESHVISVMDASRQSGFPQMERVGDTVYFAWTDLSMGTSQVKTAFVHADRF